MQLSPAHEKILALAFEKGSFTYWQGLQELGFTHRVTGDAISFLIERKLMYNTGTRRRHYFVFKLTDAGRSEIIAQRHLPYTAPRLTTTT